MENRYSKSYGIILLIDHRKTVLIERIIPYVRLHFEMRYKNKANEEKFLNEFLPKQPKAVIEDYKRFVTIQEYEDKFDFPHGQKDKKEDKFTSALREFKEETGYTFDESKATFHDQVTIEFTGLDGYFYSQEYYIISVPYVELLPKNKKELSYTPHIMDIEEAIKILCKQQSIKKDNKHKVLLRAAKLIK